MDQTLVTQQQTSNLRDVTLVILAGGEGSRMGKPKGLLEVAGQPILAHLLTQFAWPGPTLLVTSPPRENPPGAQGFDRAVADPVAGEGPLRGVVTALQSCRTPVMFITTVDMPGVSTELAKWMIERLSPDANGVMCRHNGRIEPFPLLLRTSSGRRIEEQFDRGERSVQALASLVNLLDPAWPEAVWTNLNRPDEFAAWVATVSASPPARR